MRRRPIVAAVLALAAVGLIAVATARNAAAQPAPTVGAQVKDAKGQPIGVIEKIVTDAQGQPRQVLIREGRLLRTLPIDGLKADGQGFSTELTKAEFEALPGVE